MNQDDQLPRIVFISGVRTHPYHVARWRQSLEHYDVEYLVSPRYMWWEVDQINAIIARGVTILDDGKPSVIVAHSFGGLIAKAVIARSQHADIRGLVTMATPHTMQYLGVAKTKTLLNIPVHVDVPMITYGGYFDPVVPYKYTSLPNIPHQNLMVEHIAFLFSKRVHNTVLLGLREMLRRQNFTMDVIE